MGALQIINDIIDANITTNGNEEITGALLNSVLESMCTYLEGVTYYGIIVPASATPSASYLDKNLWALASTDGTYTNFSGLTISHELSIFIWNGIAWSKSTIINYYLPTYSGDTTKFLRGDGIFAVPSVAISTMAFLTKSANYTMLNTDDSVEVDTLGVTITLPTAVGITGKVFRIINVSGGSILVQTTGVETIGNKSTGNTTSVQLLPEEWLEVVSNGTDYRII